MRKALRRIFWAWAGGILIAIPASRQAFAAVNAAAVLEADKTLLQSSALVFAPTNSQVLLDMMARKPAPLVEGPNDSRIASLTTLILEQSHMSQQELDNAISSRFLDRYIDMLDNLRLHFLASDVQDFEEYRTKLDDLTKKGDTAPAQRIFKRFLQRLEERVAYVADLVATEKFEFTGNDRYNVDRRKAARPQDLEEAKSLWRQHLRHEILQEKLNKEKPDEIANKITRRYARLLRTLKEYDNDDVFELYLSALAQSYDPHSDYMGKSSLETFNINMKLSLFGIGALLRSEDGYCKIQSLVANGPAAKSKQLKENDRIIAVAQTNSEPVDVVEMKLNKVVEMIRGAKGTEVRLTVIPADASDPSVRKVVTLIRDEIKLEDQEAKAKIIDLPCGSSAQVRIGVIDLPSFYADFDLAGQKSDPDARKSTTRDVKMLLKKLIDENVHGLVLDLRRNGGGSLEEAINLTGLFIKEGPVVQVRDHDEKVTVDKDPDPSVFYDGPLVVLTSRFSASASEILAGALQDYGRALIVGDKSTHGKGTVQSLVQLDRVGRFNSAGPNPGALKITIRKFYRASGSSTQKIGVIPDLILDSPNNYTEVGEASLENAMPWDTIPSAKFERLNRIQPHLSDLQRRSAKRLESDKDFEYWREDIEQIKKVLADRSVSLNEAQRLKEKQEAEARTKARQQELKSRADAEETVYEIPLKLAVQPGLPPAVVKTNAVPRVEAAAHPEKDAESDEAATGEPRVPAVDVAMKETKRILVDLISLLSNQPSVAAANAGTPPAKKAPGDLTSGTPQ